MYSFVTPKERPTADRATISQNSITPSDVTTYSNDIGHCSVQSNFSRQIKKLKRYLTLHLNASLFTSKGQGHSTEATATQHDLT